jgi:hypothetical protein
MDTPAPATEPEPSNAIPPKAGWMAGWDLEVALVGAVCAVVLIELAPRYVGPDSPLSPPLQVAWECLKLASMFGSLLFSFSGLRHEKNLRQIVCVVIFSAWILLFLVILRIAWH